DVERQRGSRGPEKAGRQVAQEVRPELVIPGAPGEVDRPALAREQVLGQVVDDAVTAVAADDVDDADTALAAGAAPEGQAAGVARDSAGRVIVQLRRVAGVIQDDRQGGAATAPGETDRRVQDHPLLQGLEARDKRRAGSTAMSAHGTSFSGKAVRTYQ